MPPRYLIHVLQFVALIQSSNSSIQSTCSPSLTYWTHAVCLTTRPCQDYHEHADRIVPSGITVGQTGLLHA